MKKNKNNVFDNFMKELKKGAKGAPSAEEILAEFEHGDYSSLDPEFIKDNPRKNKKNHKRG